MNGGALHNKRFNARNYQPQVWETSEATPQPEELYEPEEPEHIGVTTEVNLSMFLLPPLSFWLGWNISFGVRSEEECGHVFYPLIAISRALNDILMIFFSSAVVLIYASLNRFAHVEDYSAIWNGDFNELTSS